MGAAYGEISDLCQEIPDMNKKAACVSAWCNSSARAVLARTDLSTIFLCQHGSGVQQLDGAPL